MGLWLNLCAGSDVKEGYRNIDRVAGPGVEVVDLNVLPWPWEDGSVEKVYVKDGAEHLYPLGKAEGQANIDAVMREMHRILAPGGTAEIIVHSTDGPGAWGPGSVTYWNRNTFLYFLEEARDEGHPDVFPGFTIRGRELGVGDTMADDRGVIWTVARIRKVESPVPGESEGLVRTVG